MKKDQLTKSERKLAVLLIRYMQKNPGAKHMAEGVARWWIIQQKFEEELKSIDKVLKYLIRKGMLQEVVLSQDQKYYKINSEKVIQWMNEFEEL